jgi:hypothetical protein
MHSYIAQAGQNPEQWQMRRKYEPDNYKERLVSAENAFKASPAQTEQKHEEQQAARKTFEHGGSQSLNCDRHEFRFLL